MAYFNLFDKVNELLADTSVNIMEFQPDVPAEIREFLGNLSMLKDIPSFYLVPDEKLVSKFKIPVQTPEGNGTEDTAIEDIPNVLRFFFIDPYWVNCLLNGALNAEPGSDISLLLEKAMSGNYMSEVFLQTLIKRTTDQLGKNYEAAEFKEKLIERLQAKGIEIKGDEIPEKATPTNAQGNWRFTGFLLRSPLIEGFRGWEIVASGKDAYEDDDSTIRKLQIIRMDRLAPDLLFCLCEGFITEVLLTQPSETLHFGLHGDYEDNTFYKALSGFSAEEAKEGIIDVPLRSGSKNRRVLKIAGEGGLIERMENQLETTVTATEFAMEMISKPIKNKLSPTWKQKNQ